MRLVQPPGRIAGGRVTFKGRDLLDAAGGGDAGGARRGNRAHLSRADDRAQSGVHRRRPDRGNAARPPARHPAGRQDSRGGVAGCGARPRSGGARPRLSASALRRDAAARPHRDGAGLQALAGDRRRAHHRARRHDSGADSRPAARDEVGIQPVAAPDHARSGHHRRDRRPRRRHVRGSHRGRRIGPRDLARAQTSVYAGPARIDSRRRARRASARHRGHRPDARRAAAGLRLQPPLSVPVRAVHDRRRRRSTWSGPSTAPAVTSTIRIDGHPSSVVRRPSTVDRPPSTIAGRQSDGPR